MDGYTKNGLYGRVQDQILRLEAEGRKARAESFIVIPKQGIWKRMGRRTFYRLFGLHYVSEEDDPPTRGIQAAINRAHSKIFIKDGTYYLNKAVQYPTNNPNSPSVLWFDYPKTIVLEGESPDAVLQIDGVLLSAADDAYVNKPFVRLQTLTLEGVNHPAGITFGGNKGGYFFLWDITLTNVQDQSIFATDFISVRNMRIFNTLQNTGPVGPPGGLNFNTGSRGEIDGYYVFGYSDNALAFNNGSAWFNANHIEIFRGGLTQIASAVLFSANPSGPYNVNIDNVVTDGTFTITSGGSYPANINVGKLQLLPGGSILLQGSTLTDVNISSIVAQTGGPLFSVFATVDRFTVGQTDIIYSNPNSANPLLIQTGSNVAGKIRFGKVKIYVQNQPSGGISFLQFQGTGSTLSFDADELTIQVGVGSVLLTGAQTPPPGTLIRRALINGVLQTFPVLPNISPEIPVNPPASGVTYQNSNAATIVLLIPVALTPTSSSAASASIAVGTSPSSLSTVQTLTQAAGAGPVGGVLQAAVPSGQYYQITLTNATAYQAIVLPE